MVIPKHEHVSTWQHSERSFLNTVTLFDISNGLQRCGIRIMSTQ